MNARSGNLVNRIFERAPFIRSLGIDLISFGDGWCETRVNVRPVLNDVAQPLVIVPGNRLTRVQRECLDLDRAGHRITGTIAAKVTTRVLHLLKFRLSEPKGRWFIIHPQPSTRPPRKAMVFASSDRPRFSILSAPAC